MRLTCLGFVAFALLLLSPVSGPGVLADDEHQPGGMTDAEASRLCGKLRSRAAGWWGHRKRLSMVCPQCKGAGKVRWKRGRRRVLVDCPKCDGNGIRVDRDEYRYCFYDMRSPAFRFQEGIRARVAQEYVSAQGGKPFPTIIKRYAIKKTELLDRTHGIVHVERNKDSVARPQRWIWAKDDRKSATWYLYDSEADGSWSTDGERAEEAVPGETVPGETVPEQPVPQPVAPRTPPPQPEPAPRPPDPIPRQHKRVDFEESQALYKGWTEERNHLTARAIRIRLGLENVEGHKEEVANARTFLEEIGGWLEEEKPVYERIKKDIEEKGLGIRLDDRIKINTLHFKAHRRLDLVERMLVAVVPDLRD